MSALPAASVSSARCCRCAGPLGPINGSGVCSLCYPWVICPVCDGLKQVRKRGAACADCRALMRRLKELKRLGHKRRLPEHEREYRLAVFEYRAEQGLLLDKQPIKFPWD